MKPSDYGTQNTRFAHGADSVTSSVLNTPNDWRKSVTDSVTHSTLILSVHAEVYNLFNLGRHLLSAKNYRMFRDRAFTSWEKVVTV